MRFDRRMKWGVLFMMVALAAALSAHFVLGRAREKERIAEAVFRYQMDHLVATHTSAKVNIYFLAVDGKDPSDALLRRFRERHPPVKRDSDCDFGDLFRDKQTGMPGVSLEVSKLRWLGPRRVQFLAADCRNGVDGYGSLVILERTRGGWKVISDRLEWMS